MLNAETIQSRVRDKFPELKVIGVYNKSTRKVLVACEKCGHEFDLDISKFSKRRVACKNCYNLSLRKTNSTFLLEMQVIHPTINVLSEYVTATKKIDCECSLDGYKWTARPNDLLSGKGCPKCSGNLGRSRYEANQSLAEKNINVERLDDGNISGSKPAEFRCFSCGKTFKSKFVDVLRSGCPECNGKKRMSAPPQKKFNVDSSWFKKHYLECLIKINSTLRPIEMPSAMCTKITHYCTKHNVELKTSPERALNGGGCFYCRQERSLKSRKISTEVYIQRLLEKQPTIKLTGVFDGINHRCQHSCTVCGIKWTPFPQNLLRGEGCPNCKKSHGENRVEKCLTELGLSFIKQYRIAECKSKRALPFDFYVPTFNTLIEYQGMQHYCPASFGSKEKDAAMIYFKKIQAHDAIKRDYCETHDIPLIVISYLEFDKIEYILGDYFKPQKEGGEEDGQR